MKLSTAKKHLAAARKAFKANPSAENQTKLDKAIAIVKELQIQEPMETEPSDAPEVSTDKTIEDNLANGKDAVIIKLVQDHGLTLAKAAVVYRTYATAHDLDDKKNSMSHQLIEQFT